MADAISEPLPAHAWFGGELASELEDVSNDPAVLDGSGRWAVVVDFDGRVLCARFRHWRPVRVSDLPGRWRGPRREAWRSSLDRDRYRAAVGSIREAIGRGDVYQANLCRVLSADLPHPGSASPLALARGLASGNPAPYAGAVQLEEAVLASAGVVGGPAGLIASASPELFLGRTGQVVVSRPIKGTAISAEAMLDKDRAENVMIVDLVRNDLGMVAEPGSVSVPEFLAFEAHPGLVHLVSGVHATLRSGVGWPELLSATFPPGSVTGAPKSSALRIIEQLEPVPRGPYCGAIGWVDADRGTAELAVGIRSFWITREGGRAVARFGTGAGITWGSSAAGEWQETELKAANLIRLASEETTEGAL